MMAIDIFGGRIQETEYRRRKHGEEKTAPVSCIPSPVFSSLTVRGRIQETGDRIQEKETGEEKTAPVSCIPSPVFSSLQFQMY
jgi:hypothetical protein